MISLSRLVSALVLRAIRCALRAEWRFFSPYANIFAHHSACQAPGKMADSRLNSVNPLMHSRIRAGEHENGSRARVGIPEKGGLAPQAGLEPATLRLTAGCSAIELLR